MPWHIVSLLLCVHILQISIQSNNKYRSYGTLHFIQLRAALPEPEKAAVFIVLHIQTHFYSFNILCVGYLLVVLALLVVLIDCIAQAFAFAFALFQCTGNGIFVLENCIWEWQLEWEWHWNGNGNWNWNYCRVPLVYVFSPTGNL